MITPPKIATLQFIVVVFTSLVKGKKLKSHITSKTMIEMVSQIGVNLPMFHLAGGRG
jgi:tRNA A-37 threonylcarbamoyl transferase component Bud32